MLNSFIRKLTAQVEKLLERRRNDRSEPWVFVQALYKGYNLK